MELTPMDRDPMSDLPSAIEQIRAASRMKVEVWEQPYAEARGVVVNPADLRAIVAALDEAVGAMRTASNDMMHGARFIESNQVVDKDLHGHLVSAALKVRSLLAKMGGAK